MNVAGSSRFARLLMLALLLAMSAWQPAAAQDDDGAGPSILRDTETELLFKDISRPLIEAAGLDPNSVKVVLLNDPGDQRLRRDRADRLHPVRPV